MSTAGKLSVSVKTEPSSSRSLSAETGDFGTTANEDEFSKLSLAQQGAVIWQKKGTIIDPSKDNWEAAVQTRNNEISSLVDWYVDVRERGRAADFEDFNWRSQAQSLVERWTKQGVNKSQAIAMVKEAVYTSQQYSAEELRRSMNYVQDYLLKCIHGIWGLEEVE